jgi:hypothetical protein
MSQRTKAMMMSLFVEVLNGKRVLFMKADKSFSLQYTDKDGLVMEEFKPSRPTQEGYEKGYAGVWIDEEAQMTEKQLEEFMKGLK